MINELLVNLVNSVLGPGKRTARGNQAHNCPFCNHHKPKLEINFTENKQGNNPWHCWACDKRGKTLRSLFKQVDASPESFSELNKLVKSGSEVQDYVVNTSLTPLLTRSIKSVLASVLGKFIAELKLKVSWQVEPTTSLCGDGIFEVIEPAFVGTH